MVRQEKLSFLAKNPFYTKRFAFYVGKRCQSATILDVAKELKLDWKTVKELEKEYLREKLNRAGPMNPQVIGVDEISRRKGHTYNIIVSDLEAKRPIWCGGKDRPKESMRRRRPFSMTVSMLCGTWAKLWTKYANRNISV